MTRTLVISDTHMPRGRLTSEKPLLGLLAECDRLVVNGDLAELHQPGLIERSKHLVDALREQAAARNTTLELLAGNHDRTVGNGYSAVIGIPNRAMRQFATDLDPGVNPVKISASRLRIPRSRLNNNN